MCIIKNGNDEGLLYKDGMVFEVRKHYYEGKLIAYNLYLEDELVDSYDDEETSILAMKVLLKELEKFGFERDGFGYYIENQYKVESVRIYKDSRMIVNRYNELGQKISNKLHKANLVIWED